jgi:hypothetical protein
MYALPVLIAGMLAAWFARRRARARQLPARAVIVSPRRSSTMSGNGAVHSAQSAMLTVRQADLDRLWNATNLENLARTYWLFLQRVTLGLIRVRYGPGERRVMLLIRPLTLLRFEAPEYLVEADHGNVSWRIRDGLLVARPGRGSGHLSIDIRRQSEEPAGEGWVQLRVEIEVTNFYPSIAAGFSTYVYTATQSLIHVLVTHSFLRSLARLELAESRVGRLATAGELSPGRGDTGQAAETQP